MLGGLTSHKLYYQVLNKAEAVFWYRMQLYRHRDRI